MRGTDMTERRRSIFGGCICICGFGAGAEFFRQQKRMDILRVTGTL